MEIKQLQYFLAIAEEGQITAAAQRLGMAQPPLSQQLKLLEDELGVKLVKRGPRRLKLTDAGEILRAKAGQILELTDSAVREIADFRSGLKGTLAIGTISSSGAALFNQAMVEYRRQYPGIRFEIHEGNTFTVIDRLNKGLIEIGIVRTPFNPANFECRYLSPEPMIAAMIREHDWNPAQSAVPIEALRDKPLILYRRFEQLIYDTCLEHGFEPEFCCRNDDARTTLLWANAGFGIGILPRSAFELGNNANLRFKEIECEQLRTRIAAIWVKDRYISTPAVRFIESFGGAEELAPD